ncbi:MAG: hypothetical protein A3H98_01625 [Bacteroidetes bacterium RIFCSPLOWO2_02_FULL_36_8]|nr:MAG: hypothetical protein A3H98_01625 [Bacteroidetes bacterium RIFCSPLOWO2_02_FULL_36_8]OFY69382.1 MAG: hypothetical protein A3G23_00970 [Bacteroidetes bacterium RIFCSPLOWO2_12_FULL_37_12]
MEKDELIASIIVHAPDAVIIIDEQSIITEWNPKAESIFGWKREEAVGKYLHETIIPLQYRTAHIKGLKHYLSYGEGPVLNKPIELSALRKDNTEFDCGLTISPFILKGKKYFISFLRDISQKKKNEEKLKKLTNDLTESNIELEQFAYIASHDLQEPLRMVSSYVQMLANRFSDKLGDDGNDFINFAVDGAKRMRLLIQGLLDYSRVNTIKQYEPINTNKLVEDVLKDLMMVIKDKKVSIKVENLPDVFGNYVLISHLFQNLISNAIKFQSQRKPEILVSGKNTNGQILFSIKDNGIGIEKEYFDKIFIIFSRLHSKDKYPGTGIGLAICKKIVQKHGGKIWVESKFRKGSTFYFTLADH